VELPGMEGSEKSAFLASKYPLDKYYKPLL
jgi:hypothetical protein